MKVLLDALREALDLVTSADGELASALVVTLLTSGAAIMLAGGIGIGTGFALALSRFPGRRLVLAAFHTGMGLPPVLIGLLVALTLWHRGPLGDWQWMYTPYAMVLAQTLLATPIIVSLTCAAVESLEEDWFVQMRAIGASRWQMAWLLVRETRLLLAAALMAGWGRVVAEVGAVWMVGGNLRLGGPFDGDTRTLSTSLLMWVRRGEFERALAFGLVLLLLSFVANFSLTIVQRRAEGR